MAYTSRIESYDADIWFRWALYAVSSRTQHRPLRQAKAHGFRDGRTNGYTEFGGSNMFLSMRGHHQIHLRHTRDVCSDRWHQNLIGPTKFKTTEHLLPMVLAISWCVKGKVYPEKNMTIISQQIEPVGWNIMVFTELGYLVSLLRYHNFCLRFLVEFSVQLRTH